MERRGDGERKERREGGKGRQEGRANKEKKKEGRRDNIAAHLKPENAALLLPSLPAPILISPSPHISTGSTSLKESPAATKSSTHAAAHTASDRVPAHACGIPGLQADTKEFGEKD